jgi:hypothetical protein
VCCTVTAQLHKIGGSLHDLVEFGGHAVTEFRKIAESGRRCGTTASDGRGVSAFRACRWPPILHVWLSPLSQAA